MTKQGFCRTGQAGKALGLSAHQVRRLCESGLVEAELGPGGHWRIPVREVARLQKEGIPLIPSAVDDSGPEEGEFETRSRAMFNASPRPEVLASSSGSLIASDQEEVHVGSNCLERSKIGKGTELDADW